MNYYLLVYDRNEGELVEKPKEYHSSERRQAWSERLELELKYFEENKKHIETVLFGAKSLEDLKKTHGRYFFNYKLTDKHFKEIRDRVKKL